MAEWASLPDWLMYRVSDGGVVQSRWQRGGGTHRNPAGTWRDVTGDITSGYRRVIFYAGKRRQRWLVHRLVLMAFCGRCPHGMEACHKNGNRLDNRLSNLYWGTPQQNWEDRRKHGRVNSTKGSRNIHAVLVEDDVREIRQRVASGAVQAHVAREFKVSKATVSMICSRQTWRHVNG